MTQNDIDPLINGTDVARCARVTTLGGELPHRAFFYRFGASTVSAITSEGVPAPADWGTSATDLTNINNMPMTRSAHMGIERAGRWRSGHADLSGARRMPVRYRLLNRWDWRQSAGIQLTGHVGRWNCIK
jgi:hypothetical protein